MPSGDEIIPDGYTLQGYIAEIPGVSPALSFTYRPVDPMTMIRFRVRKQAALYNKGLSPEEREIQAELLDVEMAVKNTSWWDLRTVHGESVEGPPSVNAVCRYFTLYQYDRFLNIVNAGRQSDPRPDGETTPAESGDLDEAAKNSNAA